MMPAFNHWLLQPTDSLAQEFDKILLLSNIFTDILPP